MKIEAIERQRIAQAAVDRFLELPFEWGKVDCVRLAAFVLRARGHKAGLAKLGRYGSALGAARAMRRAGFASLAEGVDAIGLQRIAPAAAYLADLVLIPAPAPFHGALTVAVGNGRLLGFHEDQAAGIIIQPLEYLAAWRV